MVKRIEHDASDQNKILLQEAQLEQHTHRDQDCLNRKQGNRIVKSQETHGYGLSNKYFGQNNQPNTATEEFKKCKYCQKQWVSGHRCKEFYEQKNKAVLSVQVKSHATFSSGDSEGKDIQLQEHIEKGIQNPIE